MKNKIGSLLNLLLVIAISFLAVSPALAAAQPTFNSQGGVGRYIVQFRAASSTTARGVSIDRARAKGAKVLFNYEKVMQGFAAELTPDQAAALKADPSVARVLPDVRISLSPIETQVQAASNAKSSVIVQSNVPWGLDRIDQRMDLLNQTYNYAGTAAAVHVYVLDTGINGKLPEFEGRIGNGVDLIDPAGGARDCAGHGTHVAGIIGSRTYGVAKKVILHPVRVLDCEGYGFTSGIIAGIEWVAQNHKSPAVANMSLGGSNDPWMDTAAQALIDSGVTLVVAAGNDSADACYTSPADVNDAITVGATDSMDAVSWFSNTGPCVDIYAPGSYINSVNMDGGSVIYSGTSMASPHVAGAAALYLADHPAATPAEVSAALLSTATEFTSDPLLLLYSLGERPEAPQPLRPTGTAVTIPNSFYWTGVDGATDYKIRVLKGSREMQNVTGGVCTDLFCSLQLDALPAGSFTWSVSAFDGSLWSPWSIPLPLKVVAPGNGQHTTFAKNIKPWVPLSGTWKAVNGNLVNTPKAGIENLAKDNSYYTDMNLKVRFMRPFEICTYNCSPTMFYFRSNTDTLGANGVFNDGVALTLYNDGLIAVWVGWNTMWTPIYIDSATVSMADWNDLEVDLNGNTMIVVLNGTEYTIDNIADLGVSGQTVIGQYSESTTDQLLIDEVTITRGSLRSASARIATAAGFEGIKPAELLAPPMTSEEMLHYHP